MENPTPRRGSSRDTSCLRDKQGPVYQPRTERHCRAHIFLQNPCISFSLEFQVSCTTLLMMAQKCLSIKAMIRPGGIDRLVAFLPGVLGIGQYRQPLPIKTLFMVSGGIPFLALFGLPTAFSAVAKIIYACL